ncbi:MAG: 3-phosphoshikimate 1-carboxyvinyltransferase [Thermomicrobium sp.]|nr:3-phosphoshikimate 1-carboxyvinyltransferase [Thermomicrobium sp.]MDW8060292.1 3-phosphoshikimate 1-carboxyvinyltransferase [Thermomicrobium sp.]
MLTRRTYPERLAIRPADRPVDAEVRLPGSKSLTNRALVLAALADGTSVLEGALLSEDSLVMVDSLRRLGIAVEVDECAERMVVAGRRGTIPAARAELFVGNSGTTARFLTAMVALGHGEYVIDGVPRMRERPIEPLLAALRELGVEAESLHGTGCPPVRVRGRGLRGGSVRLRGDVSSQYLSALLMVGPCTTEGLRIELDGELVSIPYVEMTLATMADFGAEVRHERFRVFDVPGGQRYRAREYGIEPDASAASYFFALAAATGGRVRVLHLGTRSRQGDVRFVDLLERMGCTVLREPDAITVIGRRPLQGIETDMNAISDTVPTLAALAPLAEGPVVIRNVQHIRYKETDRIAAVATELRRLGLRVDEFPDGLAVFPGQVRPAVIRTYQDHRMAMSFAVLGCAVPGIVIDDPGCVAKTFPDFFERLEAALGQADGQSRAARFIR